ncbi:hypothetical protein [Flavobacterium sp.]|jgi:hypothetical protein|uniref:hypothetical protein n=1 Tax=Flavobacterium sp. TaxID=239 RepID=UPI0037BF6CF7
MLTKVRSQELEAGSEKGEMQYLKSQIPNSRLKTVLFGICFFFFGICSYAQCAMCRAALTSEGNAVKAQAVNDGIVYLMVIPYILVAGIWYYIYRMRKKNKQ